MRCTPVLVLCCVLCIAPSSTLACTSIGFAGTACVAENRDAPITGDQRLALFKP
jgi:hypothetical protein